MRYSSTSNVEAWNLWVQGLAFYRSGIVTKDGVGKARTYWERALALDPNSASLHAMLGFLHRASARFGWWGDRAAEIEKCKALLARALELDPDNADAHLITGMVLNHEHRFDESVASVRRGIALAPGSADIAAFAATSLAEAGVHDEAIVQIEKAMRLSPNFPPNYLGIQGHVYRLAGRTEDAIAAFRAYGQRSPGFGHADLAIMYEQAGRHEEAKAEIAKLRSARPTFTVASYAATQFRKDAAGVESEFAALRAAGLPE
jgi:adenylate cyclase